MPTMAPQGKKAAGLMSVPTGFDLKLDLSQAIEEAESMPEEDLGEDAEGGEGHWASREPDMASNADREGW